MTLSTKDFMVRRTCVAITMRWPSCCITSCAEVDLFFSDSDFFFETGFFFFFFAFCNAQPGYCIAQASLELIGL